MGYIGPQYRITPIWRYLTLFGVLMISATFFNGVFGNFTQGVRSEYFIPWKRFAHIGPRYYIAPIQRDLPIFGIFMIVAIVFNEIVRLITLPPE